jgi:PBSX family phage terminase large subunit
MTTTPEANRISLHPKYSNLFRDLPEVRYFIITGGRGSAKSFDVSTWACDDLTKDEPRKTLFTRYTMTAANISIIPEFSEKIDLLGMHDSFDVQLKDIINTDTENAILFRGIKTSSGNQTANLKSIQGITTWILDEAEELEDEDTFDKIDLSIRDKKTQNRVIIVLNPCHTKHWINKRFFDEPEVPHGFNGIVGDTCYIHTSYLDNWHNLSESFLKIAARTKRTNEKKYNHLFLGDWVDDIDGALWKQSTMIDPYRVTRAPDLKRIVIGVDPSVSSTGDQDECGIGAAGIGFDGEYYVLEDATALLSPAEWGKTSVGLYKNHQADRIVAEVNQGGDLVEMNIHNVDSSVPVKKVRATRGKLIRAEPISALYEEGKVHHVGCFPELEDEMTTYTGDGDSPNRLDWLVWALTELSQNEPDEAFLMTI